MWQRLPLRVRMHVIWCYNCYLSLIFILRLFSYYHVNVILDLTHCLLVSRMFYVPRIVGSLWHIILLILGIVCIYLHFWTVITVSSFELSCTSLLGCYCQAAPLVANVVAHASINLFKAGLWKRWNWSRQVFDFSAQIIMIWRVFPLFIAILKYYNKQHKMWLPLCTKCASCAYCPFLFV